jgi:ribosome-binding factor A
MTLRQDKLASSIQKIAGEFINTQARVEGVLITPIKADVSKDLAKSTIYITVFPDDKENHVLNLLKFRRSDFREFFKSHIKLRVIPFFDFKIDLGEKNRQRIEELSE